MKKILSGLLFTVMMPICFLVSLSISVHACFKYKSIQYIVIPFLCIAETYKTIATTGHWFKEDKKVGGECE